MPAKTINNGIHISTVFHWQFPEHNPKLLDICKYDPHLKRTSNQWSLILSWLSCWNWQTKTCHTHSSVFHGFAHAAPSTLNSPLPSLEHYVLVFHLPFIIPDHSGMCCLILWLLPPSTFLKTRSSSFLPVTSMYRKNLMVNMSWMNRKTNEVTVNNIKSFSITDTWVVPLNHVHVGPLSLNVAKMQKVNIEINTTA